MTHSEKLLKYWLVRHTDNETVYGIISTESSKKAINYFVERNNLNPAKVQAYSIITKELLEKVGENVVKCETQSFPKEHIEKYKDEIKPHLCSVYAMICTEFECEDSYLCQSCRSNRGTYLMTRTYHMVYIWDDVQKRYNTELCGI